MARYSSCDGATSGTDSSAKRSVSRKCDDGKTRSFTLPEGVTCGPTTADFAAAAASHSVKGSAKWKHDGLTHAESDTFRGDRASTVVLELGDSYVPPVEKDAPPVEEKLDTVPESLKKRGRNGVGAPSDNATAGKDGATGK